MVSALFTLMGSIERASRLSKGATELSLLQVVGDDGRLHPSEIAERQRVHPSLVTRQLQSLEGRGYVRTGVDPRDHRARLVKLTPAGKRERTRLQKVGVDRFALFVEDWQPQEVRTLTALLVKLEASKSTEAARARRSDIGRGSE